MRATDLEGERWASLRSVASEGRLDLRPLELDVREDASCRAAIDRILADEGRVDVVMNNAAMMMHGLTEAFRPEQVLQILDLNAVSWLRVNRAALPVMRRAGKGLLIYTGSGINRLPDPFTGPYAASKAAGDVLAEIMALETARYGIETVLVQPGAYTSGTDYFKHAVRPLDSEVKPKPLRICSDGHVPSSKHPSKPRYPFSVSSQRRRGSLMRPTIYGERGIATVVEVQRVRYMCIRHTQLDCPQFSVELNGIKYKSIDAMRLYNR
jgi:NAD(P)-dependent dehydrogenase (short-subunit alcohol dehydrogenase family)